MKSKLLVAKISAQCLLAIPLLWLVYLIFSQSIGPDPAEKIVRDLGFAGACILWLTLAMTPLKIVTGKGYWIAFRRLLGLWSFAYLSLHMLAFVVFWAGLNWGIVLEELIRRPYIYVGFAAWVLLLPLAITSTRKARRSMGLGWQKLHRLIYVIAGLGLLHIIWFSKLEYTQPMVFGGLLVLLLSIRIWHGRRRQLVAVNRSLS